MAAARASALTPDESRRWTGGEPAAAAEAAEAAEAVRSMLVRARRGVRVLPVTTTSPAVRPLVIWVSDEVAMPVVTWR